MNKKKPCLSDIDKLLIYNEKLKMEIMKLKTENKKLKTEAKIHKNDTCDDAKIIPDFETHGYETYDNIITENEVLQIFDYGCGMFNRIIERIHFNEKFTEFQNIYISNLSKKLICFNNKKGCNWVVTNSQILLDELKNSVLDFIQTHYDKLCDDLDNGKITDTNENMLKTKKYTIKIIHKMDMILKLNDNTPENNKYFIDKIIHVLYNNKKITLDTIKKYKKQSR
jgi:hypothetical protein